MGYLYVKNWQKFQHYKDRNPPWIKLHRLLLDDYEFASLPDKSKAHLILIWIFASSNEGRVPSDAGFLARKLATTDTIMLEELISRGFLIPEKGTEQTASSVLAESKQVASNVIALARSRETETEAEKKSPRASHSARRSLPAGFDAFWAAYPKRKSKGAAEKAWRSINPDELLFGTILAAVDRAKTQPDWRKDGGQFIPYPATWLNRKGWEDEVAQPATERRVAI